MNPSAIALLTSVASVTLVPALAHAQKAAPVSEKRAADGEVESGADVIV